MCAALTHGRCVVINECVYGRMLAAGHQQTHGLCACAVRTAEAATDRGRDGLGTRLAHAAHGHAQMLGFHDDNNAPRLEYLHQRVCYLARHPLLDLRSPRVHVDEPGELGQPGDLAALVWYISDMRIAEEWRQVMLAGREHLDIADEDHLVVIGVEDRAEDILRMLCQPGELLCVGSRDPAGSVLDSIPVRVLADGEQDLAYGTLDPLEIN